ncbi:hypothetical protein [Deinococcus sp. DB0503]|uniref:hypothetical protein n=1 Tax=Deinococcus sp. DB0503 TaxID=2479203 RepID=UPI0018E02C97|nr:hypothetical protein [Deinococcus sp. DB0503]MBI0446886.1 hypothetical protein [Deinococcus sp. DB0503]
MPGAGGRAASLDQFEFYVSAVTEGGVPLSSPTARAAFLSERCAAGSILWSEDSVALTLKAFLVLPDVRRRTGLLEEGVAPWAAPGEVEEAPP